MRLIDADALLKSAGLFEAKACARGCGKSTLHLAKAWLWNEVNTAPTIDAVPVVRCGECERRNKSADLTDTIYCPWLKLQMRKTDFCSYGERTDGDG